MSDNIWDGDVLNRKSNADYLTAYLARRYLLRAKEDGFVLAINAEWGLGKTFMLRCWKKDLEKSGYPAVYFDAWKNDFTPEPLVAFISEMDEGLSPFFKGVPLAKKYFSEAIRSMKKILKPVVKATLFGVAKQGLGLSSDNVAKLISEVSNGDLTGVARDVMPSVAEVEKSLSSAVDAALKQHKNTKQSIVAFKEKLSLLVVALEESDDVKLPIFIFVDELDRCRPDYAIELLEGIKHLFGVPGVYFVVATNMNQLGESTKAIYGSGFDGHRYLKRFFDMEYFLPPPDSLAYSKSLFLNFPLPPVADFYTGFGSSITFEGYDFLPNIFSVYADHFGCSLRDQFQAMKIFEAALYSVKNRRIHIHLLVYLCMLYQRDPNVYEIVYKKRGIFDHPDYKKIILNGNTGFFVYEQYNDNGEVSKVTVSPEDVLAVYSNTIFQSYDLLSRAEPIYSAKFPHSIRNELIREGGGSQSNGHYLTEYFTIVRSAGGFSERIAG